MAPLLERETELDELGRLLDQASAGAGQVVLLEGEAGIGKTSLLQAFLDSRQGGTEAWMGRCDPLATPRPLAPLHDIAAMAGGRIGALLQTEAPPFDVFRAVLDALSAPGPTRLVVIEDIHWADGASLDLVRFLSRRLGGVRAMLLLTYRTDELRSVDPALIAVGDVSSLPWASRITLGGLSRQAVELLTSGTRLDPDEVHRVTGGNAFYVTEVAAARDATVPATVRDAILARAAALSPAGRSTLEASSVVGASAELSLLLALGEMSGADECITRGVLIERDGALVFRHELARQVVFHSIPPGRRMQLAAAALVQLTREPVVAADLARLAALAEEAQHHGSALRYATEAARHAAAVRAHREAVGQYRRALRHAGGLAPADRARLFELLAYESYLTDQLPEAMAARRAALEIWRALGDRMMQGENTRWLSRIHWYSGEGEAAEQAAGLALELLEPMGASVQLAWAYSNLSQLRMLSYRHEEAVELGRRAIAVGREVGDRVVVAHALNNVGNASIRLGVEQGWTDLRESLRLALEGGYEEHAARAYVNLYWSELDQLRLDAAEVTFRAGTEYCGEHDLDTWRLYLLGARCQHLLLRGDWSGASELCADIDRGRPTSPVTRISPLVVLGLVRARRGDPEVAPALDEALRLASEANELQRLGPALIARGEAAWLRGEAADAAASFLRVRDLAAERDVWWWSQADAWLARISHPAAGTGDRAVGPYRLELAGQHEAAAAEWARLGCPYEEALALARTGATGRRRALILLEGLGARAALAVVSRALRASGVRALPRGPRRQTRANPFGLTAREVEVCALLRGGLRNAEIAARLHLAPRTVEHHVAAILSKTGASTRTEAAAVLSEHVRPPKVR